MTTRSPDENFTVHRVIRKRRDNDGKKYLGLKGDANPVCDFPIYPENVYGKVVTIERTGAVIDLEKKVQRLRAYIRACLSRSGAVFRALLN